ncbi:prepilin-type N-terminal cleavage/methylation domain-containing protein [Opitutaceae bacterium TAV1]|nr:prepilin-type N-terminal cleavage/methylation domain-containing protein [Opitutaceae bacterium TAV1]
MHPQTHPAPRKAHGFTLIELLTVIAIIGILAAIIIPTVSKVRESARRAQCTVKVRQLVIASITYGNENRGRPPYPYGTDAAPNFDGVPNQMDPNAYDRCLRPYLGDRFHALYCPGAIARDDSYNPEKLRASNSTSQYMSYQYFNRKEGSGSLPPKTKAMRFENLNNPPLEYAMWGCLTYMISAGNLGHDVDRKKGVRPTGMNAGYADGSVKWVLYDKTQGFTTGGNYRWPIPKGQ